MKDKLSTVVVGMLLSTRTHEIRKTVQFLTKQTSTSHHPCDSAIESIEPESKDRQEMSPVETPHCLRTRSLLQVGTQTEVMDAQEDAQGTADRVTERDDVGHSEVSNEGKVTLIVGVGFQSSTLFSLFSDRGSLAEEERKCPIVRIS